MRKKTDRLVYELDGLTGDESKIVHWPGQDGRLVHLRRRPEGRLYIGSGKVNSRGRMNGHAYIGWRNACSGFNKIPLIIRRRLPPFTFSAAPHRPHPFCIPLSDYQV